MNLISIRINKLLLPLVLICCVLFFIHSRYNSLSAALPSYGNSLPASLNRTENLFFKPSVKLFSVSFDFKGEAMYINGIATGVSIAYLPYTKRSLILTVNHLCNRTKDSENSSILVDVHNDFLFSRYPTNNARIAQILKTSSKYDLCLLSVDKRIKPARLATPHASPKIGQKVVTIGAPEARFPIINETYVSSFLPKKHITNKFHLDTENNIIVLSMMVFPGQSGSPVFNKKGQVVGVIFGTFNSQSYGGLIIGIKDIRKFINK